jgi:hypothetical protein
MTASVAVQRWMLLRNYFAGPAADVVVQDAAPMDPARDAEEGVLDRVPDDARADLEHLHGGDLRVADADIPEVEMPDRHVGADVMIAA